MNDILFMILMISEDIYIVNMSSAYVEIRIRNIRFILNLEEKPRPKS